MQFLHPSFLWALLALAIPVLIHLFYFRRFKRVYFTNVRFLKEIKEETSNRNKLKNLLVLLTRMLALACLVLAFAQPFLPTGATVKSGVSHVSVFVDNSFSMTASQNDIPLLDLAKEKARNIIQAYNDDDRFQVLTHDFEGRHQRFLSKEDAITYIDDIGITPSVQTMENILNRQYQLLQSGATNRISYVISDFQKSMVNFQFFQDTTMEINLLPLQSSVNKNLSVDSVWFDAPVPMANQNNRLIIRLRNGSTEDAEQVELSFRKDGQDKPIGIVDVPAASTAVDTVVVKDSKTGWQHAVVAINDYPVQFDDEYHISYFVPDTLHTLLIHENVSNRYLEALLRGLPAFSLTQQQAGQLQYQTFRQYDLILLNDLSTISSGLAGELAQYLRDGGKVLLFPAMNASLQDINRFLANCNAGQLGTAMKTKREVSLINTESFLFSEVYLPSRQNLKLPVTNLSFPLSSSATISQENLLTYRDGGACLAGFRVGEGQLFVFTAPLAAEFNDLSTNAEVFVPMVYKMAISRSHQTPLAYFIGNNMVVETNKPTKTGDFVYKVTNGTDEFIPALVPAGNLVMLDLGNQIRKAGIYDILLDNPVAKAAFNYNRLESDMTMLAEAELSSVNPSNPAIRVLSSALQANITGTINEKDRGIVLWKWFVIGALLFLAMETALIRFVKS